MKEDVLNLISAWGAVAEAINALFTVAAILIYGFAAWVAISIGRLICQAIADSYARAQQTIADIQLDADPRKEEQP